MFGLYFSFLKVEVGDAILSPRSAITLGRRKIKIGSCRKLKQGATGSEQNETILHLWISIQLLTSC